MKTTIAYSQTNTGRWCQETYDTASRHAGIRSRQLRKAGYKAHSSAMGPQVTGVGLVKLTLVSIEPGSNSDTFDLPEENWELERI